MCWHLQFSVHQVGEETLVRRAQVGEIHARDIVASDRTDLDCAGNLRTRRRCYDIAALIFAKGRCGVQFDVELRAHSACQSHFGDGDQQAAI